jgi:hypothetical protein
VKFVLEVDMGDTPWDGNTAQELGRILRYWGGAMKQAPLDAGARQDLMDSDYTPVGSWRIEA